jgi:hypothetical protein
MVKELENATFKATGEFNTASGKITITAKKGWW